MPVRIDTSSGPWADRYTVIWTVPHTDQKVRLQDEPDQAERQAPARRRHLNAQ
jgi:hypothetical protein